MNPTSNEATARTKNAPRGSISRREVLALGGAVALGGGLSWGLREWSRHESGLRAGVFIGRADAYERDLARIIHKALAELGIGPAQVKNKRIVLKPNLVETAEGKPHINTHPTIVVGAAEVFRRLGAASVVVAEGQGHRRDSRLVLEESGMGRALDEAGLPFIDLNHDEVAPVNNRGGWTALKELYLPRALLEADVLVSLPKLKTHHWAGATCAMKNMFGVMPGIVYGWPKNVLHYHGIAQSILDINATVRPALAIVDGIIGMEGDGPIMGTPKFAGCLIAGTNFPAVDASAARVMGLNVYAIRYLTAASGRLGPIHEWNIAQRGEAVSAFRTPFKVIDAPHLEGMVQA